MAKTKAQPLKKSIRQEINVKDINPSIDKFFWLIIPVFTLVYFMISRYSVGFYQDDEVAQYINMLQFWKDPWIILGNNPKPGYKIFMVLPSLISYDGVLLVNSLFAAFTVYLTYVLLKVYNINYAYVGALLLAFQPLWLDLSFRSYSEIFTALCVVSYLILFRKEKYVWSGLLLGYIFTVRQEIALLMIVMAVIYFRKKEFLSIAAMCVFPILYDLLGFVKTGDIMFVLTEMQKVAGLNYKSQGLMHYFKVYIFIVGPLCLSLFLLGFFGCVSYAKGYKEYIKKYYLFYIVFVMVFVTQLLTMFNDGPNPGNWRYLLHISPICAVFAVIGLNNLADINFRKTFYITTGIFAFLTLVFLSKTSDGFVLTDKSEYFKFAVIAVFFLITLMLWSENKVKYLNNLSVAVAALSLVSLFFIYEPRKLSAENLAIKSVADYVDSQNIVKGQVLANHQFLFFYSKEYKKAPQNFTNLNSKNLSEAPPGTVIVWDSHYGYRKEWGSDVQMEQLQSDTASYKMLQQFVSGDKKFGAFIFEKIK